MSSWHSSPKSKHRLAGGSLTSVSLADRCLQVVDFGLLAIIFLAPLFLGGRDALGKMVFIAISSIVGIAWLTRQTLLKQSVPQRFSWSYPLSLACIALLVVQLVPLPWEWLQQLAPRNVSLIPLWNGDATDSAQVGVWKTLSLTPNSTRLALALVVGYVLLFVTAVGRLQTRDDIQRLLRHMAIASIAMALFGLVQFFASNGKFFWFYEYPYSDTASRVKGSFTCSNHFVNYLVLCLGPMLAWIAFRSLPTQSKPTQPKLTQSKPTRSRHRSEPQLANSPWPLFAGLLLVVFAIILSKSRGGALAFASAGSVCFLIYYLRGFISGKQLGGLIGIGILVVGMLSVYGYDEVSSRFDDFAAGSIDELDRGGGRRKIWSANLAAIENGGLFGSGAGSHREIYPTYLPESLELKYTHAENGYLQIVTENGWFGAALLAFALLLALSWCWRANRHADSRKQLILAGAVTASLLASLVHSVVDFVWFIPACMSLTILLLACALRLAQLNNQQPQAPSPGFSKFVYAAFALLAGVWACYTSFGPGTAATHWNNYRLATSTGRDQTIKTLLSGEHESIDQQQAEELTQVMIYHLRKSLRCDPSSAATHAALATKYLRLFEQRQVHSDNAMSVSQIRDAATASQFASSKDLQAWLSRAFGDNSRLLYQSHYHARRAAKLCPLRGDVYLQLSDLCFLQGQTNDAIQAYIDQGLLLRPFDFGVVFEVGEQLSILGRDAEALAHWQRIFRDQGRHQLSIIQILSRTINAAGFLQYFQPDWQTIPYVWQNYRQTGSQPDWEAIVTYATEAAQQQAADSEPKHAIARWRSLAGMYKDLQHLEGVLYCYQQAARIAPTNYKIRRELGRTLIQLGRIDEAAPHLRWCLTRRPHDEALKAEAIHATRNQVASRSNDTAATNTQ